MLQADGGFTVRTQCLTNLWDHHTMLGLYPLKVLVIMKIIPYVSAIFNPPVWKWYFEAGRLNVKMIFVMLTFYYFCYLWIFKLSVLQKKAEKTVKHVIISFGLSCQISITYLLNPKKERKSSIAPQLVSDLGIKIWRTFILF